MPPDPSPARPGLRHYLALYAVAAAWMDFAHVHLVHRSDTLVFTLAGLYRWTPFFWEQDRVGMLLPLLIAWCPDPLGTLLLQTWLSMVMGLAVPLLLAEVVYPRPAGRAAATLANALMLALAPGRVRENLLFECCYPLAICLGCAGLVVLARGGDRPRWWRYPVAAGLFVLAHWEYVGVSVWLMPLALWVAAIRPGVPAGTLREAVVRLVRYFPGWSSLVLLAGAFGAGMWLMSEADRADPDLVKPTPGNSLPPEGWPDSWNQFLVRLYAWPGMWAWTYAAAGLAAAGLTAARLARQRPGSGLAAALAVLGLAGVTEFLFMGTREWPTANEYHLRYVIGALVSAQVMFGLVAVAPLVCWSDGRGRWIVFWAGAGMLFAGATFQYGIPAPGRPRADLDAHWGLFTPDLHAAGVDAVGGDYWVVWPAVFHANLAGPPGGRPLYGLTQRSGVFRQQWESSHPAGLRVGVPANGSDRAHFFHAAKLYGLGQPELLGRHGSLEIYLARPILPPTPTAEHP